MKNSSAGARPAGNGNVPESTHKQSYISLGTAVYVLKTTGKIVESLAIASNSAELGVFETPKMRRVWAMGYGAKMVAPTSADDRRMHAKANRLMKRRSKSALRISHGTCILEPNGFWPRVG